jgi:hypothetical protein
MTRRLGRFGALATVVLLGACGGETPDADVEAAEHEQGSDAVALDADEQRRLGIEVADLRAAQFQPSKTGPARVVDAQAVIETMTALARAETNARTSRAALVRSRDLFKLDTAVSAEALENVERQAAQDEAELRGLQARAALGFGASAPWLDAARREQLLTALGTGSTLLVSASFPSGLGAAEPEGLTLQRVGSDAERWTSSEAWLGPADPAVPGPAVLALLTTPRGLSYGERLTASVATGAPVAGTLVPAAAVVLASGEAWCYVLHGDDEFERRRVALDQPLDEGYFQADGYAAGDRVVVAGAGLLLARELGGGAEAED